MRYNRRGPRMPVVNGKFFSFDVNYGDEDVHTYYFKADSAEEVEQATGVELEYIFPCSIKEIQRVILRRGHIDTVVCGQLMEV